MRVSGKRRFLACTVLVIAVSLAAQVASAQVSLGRIPAARGTVLSGQDVALPDAFRGKAGVLVVGFSQSSRDEVANWGRRLGTDYFDSPNVAYYELAMLAEVPKFLRGLVTRKIREQVSQHGQMHFLPVGDHEDDWKAAAGYGNPNDAYVLLVDGSGSVVWRTGGALTGPTYTELQRRIQNLVK